VGSALQRCREAAARAVHWYAANGLGLLLPGLLLLQPRALGAERAVRARSILITAIAGFLVLGIRYVENWPTTSRLPNLDDCQTCFSDTYSQ
jgi:hypothetical protein